jgi:iodotyrosine deiodinase
LSEPKFIPLESYQEYPQDEMRIRATEYRKELQRRRTVRQFSDRAVPREILEECLLSAGTAPSGAHLQPWSFVVVSDPELKQKIRTAAEREEKEFYSGKAPQEWLDALEMLGTDENKPYLEIAPYLVAIFVQRYGGTEAEKVKHYYAQESVGIATGMLISAVHNAGLVSLTHTPSPMGFLNELLERPVNEKAFLLLVVGYPADDAVVPEISRKPLDAYTTFK